MKLTRNVKYLVIAAIFSAFTSASAMAAGGGCYNLMIIGVKKGKTANMTGSDRHTIFVTADGRSQINLREGDFQVIDGNGTDGSALFQLPNPTTSYYDVQAKLVGKPMTGMDLSTCVAITGGTAPGTYCSIDTLSMKRITGKPKALDVTKQLTTATIVGDFNGDGVNETITVPIFADFTDGTESYFWQVDAYGQAKAQLRFCTQ